MSILCKVLRPLVLRGERQEAGTTLKATPAEAALILESGRGELVHKDDMAAVKTAVDGATAKTLRQTAASCSFDRGSDGPWQRVN